MDVVRGTMHWNSSVIIVGPHMQLLNMFMLSILVKPN